MAVITFLSDFGEIDPYVAAVKAEILSAIPSQKIVDISHHIRRHDIGHGAYVLRNVFRSFANGSIHIVAVDPVTTESQQLVALSLEGHYFVGHNSGIYSLISSQQAAGAVVIDHPNSTFPTKSVLAKAAIGLSFGKPLSEIGSRPAELTRKVDRQIKATKREIVGQVVHIDHYGNLITNIPKSEFEKIHEMNGKTGYRIRFAREAFDSVHKKYNDVDGGDCFVLFNNFGVLEIGINKGRASDLLGLKLDTPVMIEFNI